MKPSMTSGRKTNLLAGLVLMLGLAATVLVADQVRRAIQQGAVSHFSYVGDQITQRIQERLFTYGLLLQAGAGLFAASDAVSRQEWRLYFEKLHSEEQLPGIQGLGFAELIAADRLQAHIDRMRADGFSQYSVHPPGERGLYSAIVYLEPFADGNLRAFGYDMLSEPVRRAAMLRARDSGQAALSGKVRLVQASDADAQASVLLYSPVYARGLPTDTVAQRRAALLGWVYSPYRMSDLMVGILTDWRAQLGREIRLFIHDGDSLSTETLLFASDSGALPDPGSRFYQQRHLDFQGQRWVLTLDRSKRLDIVDFWPLWLTLAAGLMISSLLFGLLRAWLGTRADAQQIAERLTADIRHGERLLQESEFRWKFALEGSNLGVWDWDIPAGKVHESQRYKDILGYAGQWLSNEQVDWFERIHPQDRPAVQAAIDACLDGSADFLTHEHRLRHKDGDYRWVLVRGMVVERDTDGAATRLLGTLSDIDERKAMETFLQQTRAELLDAQRMARAGSWSLDLASSKVVWSEQIYRLFGLDPSAEAPALVEQEHLFEPASWQRLSAALVRTLEQGIPYEDVLQVIRPDGRRAWMQVSSEAVRGSDGRISGLRGAVADISTLKEAQLRSERLSRLYATLSACNAAIVHCRSRDELFATVCRLVVESGGMTMAWIGLLDDAGGHITPVQSAGEGVDYLEGLEVSVHADDPHGLGPSGTAVRENRAVWATDFSHDPATAPWHARAAGYGWVASAALPLCQGGQPVGVLSFYSSQGGWDDTETCSLLEEMASDISYAMDKFALEGEALRHQASLLESERRFRVLIEQSIAGAYIIQDGRLVYVNPRFAEILGYPDAGTLIGRRPQELAVAHDRPLMDQQMEQLLTGEVARMHMTFTGLHCAGGTVEVSTHSSVASYQDRPAIIGLMQDMSDKAVAEAQIRRYVTQLENIFLQTVGLATTLSEMRDPYTAGHEKRVAEIAVAIGGELGLDDNTLEGLRIGGYLHDVGKMRVPTDILSKPGRLTESEYALVKEHARAGYEVLKDVEFPWPVAQIALQHHERMDGSGYPQGLKGEAILLEARITAVADVVESMASHRPYRPGLGLAAALAEIERGRGTAYDVTVVDACLRLFRERGYALPEV